MKTTFHTPQGIKTVTPNGDGSFTITHHAMPTLVVPKETSLAFRLWDVDEEITLVRKDDSSILLAQDTRHGKEGWRGVFYDSDGKWDESYLFFISLTEAMEADRTGDFTQARAAF